MPKKSKKSGKKKADAIAEIETPSSSPVVGHSASALDPGHSITFKPKKKIGEIRVEHGEDGSIRLHLLP
jgi:hypothetical protein